MSRRRDTQTLDLFTEQRLFPVEAPRDLASALDFNAGMAGAISRACDEAKARGRDRFEVARRMTEALGVEITKGMIDAYCSQARETHTISLVRFKALVRATGCVWLWEVVLEGEGLTLLQGEEATLAEAAFARQEAARWSARAKSLEAAGPVTLKPRRRK